MNELPKGWVNTKICDVFDVNPGHKGLNIDDDLEVSFVPMTAIEESTGRLCADSTRKYGEIKSGYTKFVEDDVIFAKITPCMENGKAAIAKNLKNGIGCGTTELHVFRTYFKASNSYLLYFLLQESIRESARKSFQGTSGHLRVPVAFFDEIDFPLPPLNEQRRIVAKLEEVLTKVDASQQRLAKIPVILKRFRQAVLAAACSGRLTADWREENSKAPSPGAPRHPHPKGEGKLLPSDVHPLHEGEGRGEGEDLPEGWRTVSLSKVATSRLGKMLDKSKNQGVPTAYLRNVNVRWFEFDLTDIKTIRVSDKEISTLSVRSGDVLVCEGGEPGRCAVWQGNEGDYVYQKALHRVRVGSELTSEWLCYCMKDSADAGRLSESFTGTTIKHLTGVSLAQFEFPVPPLPEQQEIVRRVESFFTLADQLEARYRTAKTHVDKLTQSILAKAFRGELVPQDPSDEPATTLLERIRAERGKATPTPARTRRS